MTLLVGIVCQDEVVVATDSQSTDEWGQKRFSRKLGVIQLDDGSSALVAEAGDLGYSGQTIERMERLATSIRLTDYRAFADLAGKAWGEVWLEHAKRFGRNRKLRDKSFEEHKFWLIIANCFKGKPYLFRFDSSTFSAALERSKSYMTVGNSYATADYILNKFDLGGEESSTAILAAIFTVNEVIGVDSTCSLPVRLGTVVGNESGKGSHARLFDKDSLDLATRAVNNASAELREAIASHLGSAIAKALLAEGNLEIRMIGRRHSTKAKA